MSVLTYTVHLTPVGPLTLVASELGLRAILWPGEDPDRRALGEMRRDDRHAVLRRAAEQLDEYFAGRRFDFDLPLDPVGTEFQVDAWRALMSIPFGETATYGEQATRVGRPTAARAIGAANGRNPLPIVVPCHRVVGADGTLTGFGGGLGTKRHLIDHERDVLARRTTGTR